MAQWQRCEGIYGGRVVDAIYSAELHSSIALTEKGTVYIRAEGQDRWMTLSNIEQNENNWDARILVSNGGTIAYVNSHVISYDSAASIWVDWISTMGLPGKILSAVFIDDSTLLVLTQKSLYRAERAGVTSELVRHFDLPVNNSWTAMLKSSNGAICILAKDSTILSYDEGRTWQSERNNISSDIGLIWDRKRCECFITDTSLARTTQSGILIYNTVSSSWRYISHEYSTYQPVKLFGIYEG
jgi:photosystem II stability/assembly factor-like uncharacterized protein